MCVPVTSKRLRPAFHVIVPVLGVVPSPQSMVAAKSVLLAAAFESVAPWAERRPALPTTVAA